VIGLDPARAARLLVLATKLAKPRALGGPGSGNFGHAGRPGEVGGSSSNSDNVIKDENGEPLVVYHGTDRSFSEFDVSHGGNTLSTNTGAANGVLGVFFTTDLYKADELYAGKRGHIVEANISLKNPERLRGGEFESDASAAVNEATAQYVGKSVNDLTEQDFIEWKDSLIRQGKDGIEVTLHPYRGKSERDFVIFEPKKIRVLSNRGKEGPLHKLADSHSPSLSVKVRYAFASARAAMRRNLHSREDIERAKALGIVVLRQELREVLPKALRKIYVEGGELAAANLSRLVTAAEWDEAEHPRDEEGQFTDSGGGQKKFKQGESVKAVKAYRGGVAEHSAEVTYATVNKDMAQSYVDMSNDRFGEGGSLHEIEVTINNPAPQSVIEQEAKRLGIDNEMYTPGSIFDDNLHGKEPVKQLVQNLRDKGYDGAVLDDIAYGKEIEDQALISFGKKAPVVPVIEERRTPSVGRRVSDRAEENRVRRIELRRKENLKRRVEAAKTERLQKRREELRRERNRKFRAAKRDSKPSVKIDFKFDSRQEASIDWADRHSAELIDGISETSREAINNAVAEYLETGDFKELRDEILAAVGDSERADRIARNEPMVAVHEGQRAAWQQAIDDGLLPENSVREWIVVGDDKVCPVCQGLEGKTAALGEEYEEGIEGPPAHVMCRCSEGISVPRGLAFNEDQPRDENGQWVDIAAARYPKLSLSEKDVRNTTLPRDTIYRGDTVDGLRVRTHIPNTSSVEASYNEDEYESLPGIRSVSLDELGLSDYASKDDNERVQKLADQITESGEISPLIVVHDSEGAYVLEGNHRARALKKAGKTKAPALVIVEHPKVRALGGPGSGNFGHAGRPGEVGGSAPDGSPEANSPEDAKRIIEEEQRKWLTPEEYERLPPGIRAWKTRTRKEKAEGKEPPTPPKKEDPPKKEEPPKVEDKPPTGVIATKEREDAIKKRADEIYNTPRDKGGKPYMDAYEQAKKEDEERNGPLPPNALSKRSEAINERYDELRREARAEFNRKMESGDTTAKLKDSEESYKQAQREDAAKWGPYAHPEEVEAIRQKDAKWSPSQQLAERDTPERTADVPSSYLERATVAPEHRSPKQEEVQRVADSLAREMNFEPALIVARDRGNSPRQFELNGKTLTEGGHYNPQTGQIEVNAAYGVDRGLIVHEIQHAQWDYVNTQAKEEQAALQSRWAREQAADFTGTKYFLKNGKVLAKYREEFEKQMPYTSVLARAGLGNKELGIKPDFEGMKRDDGVSSYSKEYWVKAEEKKGFVRDTANYIGELAVNETLSEVARRARGYAQHSEDAGFGWPERFVKLNKSVESLYNREPERVRRHFVRKQKLRDLYK
jgi:hypothetical protein